MYNSFLGFLLSFLLPGIRLQLTKCFALVLRACLRSTRLSTALELLAAGPSKASISRRMSSVPVSLHLRNVGNLLRRFIDHFLILFQTVSGACSLHLSAAPSFCSLYPLHHPLGRHSVHAYSFCNYFGLFLQRVSGNGPRCCITCTCCGYMWSTS